MLQEGMTGGVFLVALGGSGEEVGRDLTAFLGGTLAQIFERDGVIVVGHGVVAVIIVVGHVAGVASLFHKLVKCEVTVAVVGSDACIETETAHEIFLVDGGVRTRQ